MINNFLL